MFDLVVVAGGAAATAAEAGWTGDILLRVAETTDDDEIAHFLGLLDVEGEHLLGSVVGGRFEAHEVPEPRRAPAPAARPAARSIARETAGTRRPAASVERPRVERRRVASR